MSVENAIPGYMPVSKTQDSPSGEKRVLTGMRTTGELHLGHYVGALEEWLRIQKEGNA